MVQIECVDPRAYVGPVSQLLREVRESPCVHYTPEYLRWQFTFPGSVPPLGIAAFDGDEMIGFLGATPRRLRFQNLRSEAYLISSPAVREAWRPTLIPGQIYAKMLEVLKEFDLPVLGFAVPGQAGEPLAARAYPAAGFGIQTLGPFSSYGYVPKAGVRLPPVYVAETGDLSLLQAASDACKEVQTIWNSPDLPRLQHYLNDPHPRKAVALHTEEGSLIGAALIARTTYVTTKRRRAVTTIDTLFLPRPDAEALRALCHFAGQCWCDEKGPTKVVLSNVWGLTPKVLQAAGLRPDGGQFMGYVCAADPYHLFLNALGTNLERV